MEAILVLASVVTIMTAFVAYKLTFWSRQSVPNEVASLYNRFWEPFHIADKKSAEKYGDVVGIYEGLTPCLMIKDLELVKKVLIEDFWNFPNHRKFYEDGQLASQSIVVLEDHKWKRMRQILSPVFSPSKIKSMQSMCTESIDTLIQNLIQLTDCGSGEAITDVQQYYGSFSVDMICSLVFGIKINSLRDPNNEIVRQIRRFFGKSVTLKQLVILAFPVLMKLFDVYLLNYEVLQYLNALTRRMLHQKREEGMSGRDFINLLMDAKGADGQSLSEEEIADQVILFFVAGYDTSAASLSAISYCLAMNPSVQHKLFREVEQFMQSRNDAADHADELDGESMSELRYLDAVIKESMRFLPIVPRMERRCNKDCYLQSSDRKIFVPNNAMIIIPIYALNHDERYFVKPDKFDPERFLDPEQEQQLGPAYLPFAAGPRSCIGQRFAIMELKECMVQIVSRFEFDMCPGAERGLEYYRGNPVSTTKQVLLRVRRRAQGSGSA